MEHGVRHKLFGRTYPCALYCFAWRSSTTGVIKASELCNASDITYKSELIPTAKRFVAA